MGMMYTVLMGFIFLYNGEQCALRQTTMCYIELIIKHYLICLFDLSFSHQYEAVGQEGSRKVDHTEGGCRSSSYGGELL